MLPVYSSFGRIVHCGSSVAGSLPRLMGWLGGKKLECIPNGVDLNRVDQVLGRMAGPARGNQFEICYVGKLEDIKNPETALEAFAEVADGSSRFTILGDGPLRERLIERTRNLSVSGEVVFQGVVPREDVYRFLARSDVLISTSRGEGLPVAVLEAMACRCPVVLSDIAPHREIAAGSDWIPLIPVDDFQGFAREIQRFRRMSQEQRDEIGSHCRQLVESRFPLKAMHDKYQLIYQAVCRGGFSAAEDDSKSVHPVCPGHQN
jgi:glycosyltransferase involved in cell wall biosynthesis